MADKEECIFIGVFSTFQLSTPVSSTANSIGPGPHHLHITDRGLRETHCDIFISHLSISATCFKLSILIKVSILIHTSCCIVVEETLLSIPQLANQLSVVDSIADSGCKALSDVVKGRGLRVAIFVLRILTSTGPELS